MLRATLSRPLQRIVLSGTLRQSWRVQQRHFHPLLWAGLAAKKLFVFNMAEQYGIPRIYRRLLELDKRISTQTPEHRAAVRSALKSAIRFPNDAVRFIERNTGAFPNVCFSLM